MQSKTYKIEHSIQFSETIVHNSIRLKYQRQAVIGIKEAFIKRKYPEAIIDVRIKKASEIKIEDLRRAKNICQGKDSIPYV